MKRNVFILVFLFHSMFSTGQNLAIDIEDVCLHQASVMVVVNIPSGTSFVGWDLDNDGNYNDATGEQISYTFSNSGNFPIGIMLISDTGNETFFSNLATAVVHPLPLVDFIVTNSCQFDTTKFTSLASVVNGTIITYEWDLDNNDAYEISTSNNELRNLFTSYGTFSVSNRVISNAGCAKIVQKNIEIYEKPTAQFSYQNICVFDSTVFINESLLETDQFSITYWKFGDGIQRNGVENQKHVYTTPGIYEASLITISEHYCKDTFLVEVEILPIPEIEFQFDADTSKLYQGNAVNVSLSNGSIEVEWNDGSSQLSKLIETSGEYRLVVTDENGCSASDSFKLFFKEVEDIALASNLFYLNGDGMYETFEVHDKDLYQGFRLHVFNQYGIEIYFSRNYNNDWDFTYDGKQLETGAYFYIIDVSGVITKGSFNIIR